MSRFRQIQQPGEPPPVAEAELYDAAHYLGLGDAALGRGRFEDALRHYGRALERDKDAEAAWCGQVRALLAMGQPDEAATWLEQAGRVVGETPTVLALRAIAAARLGRAADALAWSDRAMRDGRDEPDVWLARAEVLYAQGESRMVPTLLSKAFERTPSGETALRCGEVALDAGDLATARRWLLQAEKEDNNNPRTALRLGVYWERAGDLARAEVELSRALSLDPAMKSARLALDDLRNRSPLQKAWASLKRWTSGG